jgi:hypothetical protein
MLCLLSAGFAADPTFLIAEAAAARQSETKGRFYGFDKVGNIPD